MNHSVGIAELRKVEVIRQNYPQRKQPITIGTAGLVTLAGGNISALPAVEPLQPPPSLCQLSYSANFTFPSFCYILRLSASDFLFSGAPRASCSLGAGVFHTQGLNGRSLKLNVRCRG